MASNPLLALLNLSSSAVSSSPAAASASHSTSGEVPPASYSPAPHHTSSPPSTSNASLNAGSLLQSIISPNTKLTANPLQSPLSSSPDSNTPSKQPPMPLSSQTSLAPSLSAAQASANDLLALLSGAGMAEASTHDRDGPATPSTARREHGSEASKQQQLQQPIGTPPSHPSRIGSGKSPIPTIFDSINSFDLLQQSTEGDSVNPPAASSDSATPQAKDLKLQRSNAMHLAASTGSAPAAVSESSAFGIDRSIHASHHLSQLHAASSFGNEESNGLSLETIDGVQHFTLDLRAAQPAGANSLYPAKVEIRPVSLLTTTFGPSCHVDTDNDFSKWAQWPCQRVAAADEQTIMYVMSKGRVRLINVETGERTLARADAPIRSLVASVDQSLAKRILCAAITEKDSLFIWKAKPDSGGHDDDVAMVARLYAERGKSFSHAQWVRNSKEELIVAQSDGQIGLVRVRELEKAFQTGKHAGWADNVRVVAGKMTFMRPVSTCTSSDGSLLATVEASSRPSSGSLHLRLQSLSASKEEVLPLPSLARVGATHVSFTSFCHKNKADAPQNLLLGFDNNQTIAVVDLHSGRLRQLYRFRAPSPSFSLAEWDWETATLLLCCSVRSSIFFLRPLLSGTYDDGSNLTIQSVGVDHSSVVFRRIKSRRTASQMQTLEFALGECALPEPYTSISLQRYSKQEKSVHLLASHLGGIHALLIPHEALSQIPNPALREGETVSQISATTPVSDSQEKKLGPTIRKQSLIQKGDVELPQYEATFIKSESDPNKQQSKSGMDGKQMEAQRKAIPKDLVSEAKEAVRTVPCDADAPENGATNDCRKTDTGISADEMKLMLDSLQKGLLDHLKERQGSKDDLMASKTAAALANAVIPALHNSISETLQPALGRAVTDNLQKTLPKELHKMLVGPELATHMTRSITSSILPSVQRTAMEVVSHVLAPHIEGIMNDMTSRMEAKLDMGIIGVRKDIVTEQSKALIETEAGIEQLRGQISALTQSMQRMEQQNERLQTALELLHKHGKPSDNQNTNHATPETLAATAGMSRREPFSPLKQSNLPDIPPHNLISQGVPQAGTMAPAGLTSHFPLASPDQPHQFEQPKRQPVASWDVPLPMTAQEAEDVLLQALSSPSSASDASSLLQALEQLENKFNTPISAIWQGGGAKPRVSQAVVLTLLHRLVKMLSRRDGEFGRLPLERAVLWMEACAAALDKNDQTIAPFLEGIKREMAGDLTQAHRMTHSAAPWWTNERLSLGLLRFLQ